LNERAFTLTISSTAAGGIWGGMTGVGLGIPPYSFGVIVGAMWGCWCAALLVGTAGRKPFAIVLPVWFGATTAALILALIITPPYAGLALPFAMSTGAYIASCIALAMVVEDEPRATPDRSRCHQCGYPRRGLPTNICPECGQRWPWRRR
jgi:hypothetical protein